MHYCKNCRRIHILNGHKQECPACGQSLTELKISYLDYVALNQPERERLLLECQDEARLSQLSTTYRMYKYSKHYKENLLKIKHKDSPQNQRGSGYLA